MRRNRKVFIDTSVIFSAVLSDSGGARKLFHLGEAGVIQLFVGPNVLRECEEVIRRKVPDSLPTLAHLLELSRAELTSFPEVHHLEKARMVVEYQPDVYVLAEAIGADPDWFVTHDKEHFLSVREDSRIDFQVGTPGDFIQALESEFRGPFGR
jgi:predicted nucleic acid-binding protein